MSISAAHEDYELIVREYVEEVVNAGGAKLIRREDLTDFITNLTLGCFRPEVKEKMRIKVRTCVELYLLPEECTKLGIDDETVAKMREALL